MFEKLLRRISIALRDREIPYIIIGGQAVLIYGEPRQTRDIDITLGVDVDRKKEIFDIVKKLNLTLLPEEPGEFIEKTCVLPCLDEKSYIRIDFMFSHSEYEKVALSRAKEFEIEGEAVRFASPEDLIVHKVVAGRARDIEDVRVVLMKQENIDIDYIKEWLHEFDRALAVNYSSKINSILEETEKE
ncbi:MAG: nucleotidyl transferase AbiEii/AbiGii toxin family protein [bacterium]